MEWKKRACDGETENGGEDDKDFMQAKYWCYQYIDSIGKIHF